MKTFETERLLLKPSTHEDAGLILQLFNTQKFIEFIGDRELYSLNDAEKYIKTNMIPQIERLGYGNYTIIENMTEKK